MGWHGAGTVFDNEPTHPRPPPFQGGEKHALDIGPHKHHNSAMSKPAPTDLVPPQWKRNPIGLWVYIAAGMGMILWSGGRIVLERIGLLR